MIFHYINNFLQFVGVQNFKLPQYHWLETSAWEIANNIGAIEMQDLQEKLRDAKFI